MDTKSREIILGDWEFNRIELKDKEIYSRFIETTEYPTDLWSSNFDYLWAVSDPNSELVIWKIVNDMLVTFKLRKSKTLQIAFPPFGPGNADKVAKVLLICMEFCCKWNGENRKKTRIRVVTKQQLEFLQTSSLFNENFQYKKLKGVDRHVGVNKLVNVRGKEFQDVRQNLNRFFRNYPGAIIRRAKPEDYHALLKLKRNWNLTAGRKYSHIWDDQFFERIIRCYQELNHIVLIVEFEKRLIGTVTGGILPHGQAWGAILKKQEGYAGLSEYLNVEFAREIQKIAPTVELINLGIDLSPGGGLRQYKNKFRPVFNAERYRILLKNEERD